MVSITGRLGSLGKFAEVSPMKAVRPTCTTPSFTGFLKFLMILRLRPTAVRRLPGSFMASGSPPPGVRTAGHASKSSVKAAIDDGVEPNTIRAILNSDHDNVPKEVALAMRFAEGVLARDGSEERAREEIASQPG